jgi:hypothetical protein
MARAYLQQDLLLTTDGDLVISNTGDLAIASIDQTTKQNVLLNVFTALGDFGAYSDMGSRLESFVGEPNTRQNAGLMESEILRAITSPGLYSPADITIKTVPISKDSLLFFLTLLNDASILNQTITFHFDYTSGIDEV